jgi:hypothetical protein
MASIRNFEPGANWTNGDDKLTDRAAGFLRSLVDALGGNSAGSGLLGALGGDGVTTTTFLREDGTFSVPAYPAGANPTASVGTTAVVGTAATFLRSDGAPAINLGIVPTWTGAHTFTVSNTAMLSLTTSTTATIGTGFGCNGQAAQTSASVNAAISATAGAAYTATEQGMLNDMKALLNQIRAAGIANGILV